MLNWLSDKSVARPLGAVVFFVLAGEIALRTGPATAMPILAALLVLASLMSFLAPFVFCIFFRKLTAAV